LYELRGAGDRVHAVRFEAPHNYNRESREAVYAWMARWLQDAPADVTREERAFTADPLPNVLVFHQRPMPAHAVTAAQLTEQWIEAATRQLVSAPLDVRARALRQALAFGDPGGAAAVSGAAPRRASPRGGRTVIAAGLDAAAERQLRTAGYTVEAVDFTPFDADAAANIPHFDTYNRTEASQRVADIVGALRARPEAALVASGDAALAGLLAAAVEPGRRAVLDISGFDAQEDGAFVSRLFIPGLRRAGDLKTAAEMAGGGVHVHRGTTPLTVREIVSLLR
jgi:hypothetical protein